MNKKSFFEIIAFQIFLSILTFLLWHFKINLYTGMTVYIIVLLLMMIFNVSPLAMILIVIYSAFHYYGKENAVRTHHITTGLLAIYMLLKPIIKKTFVRGKLFYPMMAILVYSTLTTLWSPDKFNALAGVGVILQGYAFYMVAINISEKQRVDFKQLTIITSLLSFYLAIILTVTAFDGRTFKEVMDAGAEIYRNLFDNINVISAMFGLIVPISVSKYFLFKKKSLLAMIPLDIFVLFAMYISKSRGLYFGFIMSLLITIIMLFKPKKKTTGALLTIGVVSVVVVLIGFTFLKDYDIDLYNKINEFSSSRIDLYLTAIKKMTRNVFYFVFGSGIRSSRDSHHHSSIYYHNFVIQILSTLGLVGIILYLILFVRIYEAIAYPHINAKIIVASSAFYLAHQLVDVSFELQYIGGLFYLIVGFAERNHDNWSLDLEVAKLRKIESLA